MKCDKCGKEYKFVFIFPNFAKKHFECDPNPNNIAGQVCICQKCYHSWELKELMKWRKNETA